jgi:hypothetical protein
MRSYVGEPLRLLLVVPSERLVVSHETTVPCERSIPLDDEGARRVDGRVCTSPPRGAGGCQRSRGLWTGKVNAVRSLKEVTMFTNRRLTLTLVVVSASFVPAANAMAAMNHNETLLPDA